MGFLFRVVEIEVADCNLRLSDYLEVAAIEILARERSTGVEQYTLGSLEIGFYVIVARHEPYAGCCLCRRGSDIFYIRKQGVDIGDMARIYAVIAGRKVFSAKYENPTAGR